MGEYRQSWSDLVVEWGHLQLLSVVQTRDGSAMANFGYMFFTFSVRKHGQRTPLPLGGLVDAPGQLDPSKIDAVVTLYGILNFLKGRRVTEKHRHFTLRAVEPTGRCLRFSYDLGTSGQQSDFRDPAAATDSPVFVRTDRHIESNLRRGLLVAPTNSMVGLLALESQSRSTGREQLTALLKRGVRDHTGLIVDFDAVVHQDALNAFLAQAQLDSVSLKRRGLTHDIAELLEVGAPEQHLGNLELKITRGRMSALKQKLIEKFREDDTARNRILSIGGLNFNDINMQMKVGERSTTLTIAADKMPSFIYHLSSTQRPSDEHFYGEVTAMVTEVARAFGASVGASWQAGAWSADALQTEVKVSLQEESEHDRSSAAQ